MELELIVRREGDVFVGQSDLRGSGHIYACKLSPVSIAFKSELTCA